MNLFATYNPTDYSLTGFYINQPLNNFVVLTLTLALKEVNNAPN